MLEVTLARGPEVGVHPGAHRHRHTTPILMLVTSNPHKKDSKQIWALQGLKH